jgi:hypothetical protein
MIKEWNMSGINGDKARFHRERKHKIHLRERNREMLKTLAKQANTAVPLDAKPKEKLA